jgi:hypothetical protein
MEITFHTILGSVVLILILLYVVRTLFRLNTEGFETIYTTIPTGKDMTNLCPANQTLVYQLLTLASGSTPATFKYACYSEDVTNVDETFGKDNLYLHVSTPKDYTVRLYDKKDASGTVVLSLSSLNSMTNDICGGSNYCIGDTNKTPNMKFASIKVSKKVVITKDEDDEKEKERKRRRRNRRRRDLDRLFEASKCPKLSPAAKAAAAAAEAKAKADTTRAADLALLVTQTLAKTGVSQGLLNDGVSLTCPSGDKPIMNENLMRNTKFAGKDDAECSGEYLFDPETDM